MGCVHVRLGNGYRVLVSGEVLVGDKLQGILILLAEKRDGELSAGDTVGGTSVGAFHAESVSRNIVRSSFPAHTVSDDEELQSQVSAH
jgi:hypothetical protein